MANEAPTPPHHHDEGVRPPDDPRYPPQSVLRPAVRRSALFSSVGLLAVLAILIGAGMLYWMFREKGRVDPTTPQAVGTVGTAPGGVGRTEGGFDPQKRPDNAREELERRGASGQSPGTMPALRTGSVVTEIADVIRQSPASMSGQRVDLRDVEVESGTAQSFWIRDGNAKVAVMAGGETRVTPGRKVDVKGVTEADGNGGVRVRAERVVAD